jgi:Holliday junction DNA helicase RuvA
MIARLSGTLLEKSPGLLVLDVAGVGYEVTIPLGTFRAVGEPGGRIELHVHTHVREDTLALFGFATRLEKDLFVRLLAVNGVGPKTAVALLSGLGAEPLVEAVRRRDIRRLSGAPGIGRKTAERIAVDLADRLDALAPADRPAGAGGVQEDLVSALVNLGYNARAASEAAAGALDGAPAEPPFEDLLRRALRTLSR